VSEDLEALGLLDDVDGAQRRSRRALLEELIDQGVSVAELRRAAAEHRLALLPVDRILSGRPRYSGREVAERTDLSVDYLARTRQAIGLAAPDPEEIAFDDDDLEVAAILRRFRDLGLTDESMLAVSRILGRGLAQGAEAIIEVVSEAFIEAGIAEDELARRGAEAVRELLPLQGRVLEYVLARHLREQLRQRAVTAKELQASRVRAATVIAVCFVDLVDFTGLSERLRAEEVGELIEELERVATAIARPPVRFVKAVGDAVMLVASEAGLLVDAAFELVEAVEASDGLPPARAGIASGEAISRFGDWYGRSVNVASRVAELAPRAGLAATVEVRDAAGQGYDWRPLGPRRLKGIAEPISVHVASCRED
jgi:adenylate cyclase